MVVCAMPQHADCHKVCYDGRDARQAQFGRKYEDMSRITTMFNTLHHARRVALMPYLTVGFPYRTSTLDLVPALEQAGASMIELGIPFSDPLADGATIQRASQRARSNGVTLAFCLETVAVLRARGVQIPLLLMGYYNVLLRYGIDRACHDLAQAGGDGWIIPDMPPEESDDLCTHAKAHQLDVILFVAPTTPDERIRHIAARASGFLYCVSLTGVTGSRDELSPTLGDFLARVRQRTNLPLVVGFGISTPAQVAHLAHLADGVIVGSALINHIDQAPHDQIVTRASAFVSDLCYGA